MARTPLELHLWNHENKFERGVVGANECYSLPHVGRLYWDILFDFL